MAEMPPLFYFPLDEILSYNPMGDVASKKILLPQMAARSKHYGFILIHHNNWHDIAF